jgi:hypothetical protein
LVSYHKLKGVWKGKPDEIKRLTLIGDYEKGVEYG